MRPVRVSVWACALAAFLAGGGTARAAWNNVFQVCCHHCRSAPAPVAAGYYAGYGGYYAGYGGYYAGYGGYYAGYGGYYAGYGGYAADPCCPAPCPAPCPQTTCTTRYVQRCYYQPVTCYRTSYYYQPVTTYRTNYYYEPVCTYRYSCYYDPCTCSYQQVATPVTSYRLRSQCCPVTSYLQRACVQPVTTYRQMTYYEPITTCCTTTPGAPVACPPPGAAVVPPANGYTAPPGNGYGNGYTAPPAAPPPGVGEERTPAPPPGVSESRDPGLPSSEGRRYYPPGTTPRTSDSSFYRLRPVPTPPPASPPPAVRYERIASNPGDATLEGRVLTADRAPRPGARVLFVSADRSGERRTVTADRAGQFRADLASGGWLVYLHDDSGRPVFSRRIDVRAEKKESMTLSSR
jgi:hypothetical protein